jgi:hypothetical protein
VVSKRDLAILNQNVSPVLFLSSLSLAGLTPVSSVFRKVSLSASAVNYIIILMKINSAVVGALKTLTFVVEKPGKVGLEVEARSPGASWD